MWLAQLSAICYANQKESKSIDATKRIFANLFDIPRNATTMSLKLSSLIDEPNIRALNSHPQWLKGTTVCLQYNIFNKVHNRIVCVYLL